MFGMPCCQKYVKIDNKHTKPIWPDLHCTQFVTPDVMAIFFSLICVELHGLLFNGFTHEK